jgi:hypothetical protein
MTFKSKKWFYQNNGSKGGRPKQDSKVYIKIPDINFVNITPKQYETLIKKYGNKIVKKALSILDHWLNSGSPSAAKYIGKNNYAHFRSDGWVLHEALKS